MDFRTVGAIATVLLTIPMAVAAQTTATARQTVAVRTFNYFKVSAKDLQISKAQAEAILREAGIEVEWLDCSIERDVEDARCTQPLGITDLMLRIDAARQASGPQQYVSMGFSLVNAADGKAPYLATVYADIVTSIARGAGTDMGELLGRAIAHEIGHLLLGTNRHASTGPDARNLVTFGIEAQHTR